MLECFIQKSKKIHGDKYDYSRVNYKNSKSKIEILCPKHGSFFQSPSVHLRSHGCPICGRERATQKNRLSFEEFISRSRKLHGFKFSYFSNHFVDLNKPAKIKCPEHGVFFQKPVDHLRTHGCPTCGLIKMNKNNLSKLYTTEDFVSLAQRVHKDKYIYKGNSYFRSDQKLTIICPKHGHFRQIARDHLVGHGCSVCRESRGERRIREYLKLNNISFQAQKKFKDCKNILNLRYDFFIEQLNLCIEYDGLQHFVGWNYDKGSLKYIQKLDSIKNRYCQENKIKLLRIEYFNYDKTEEIIERTIRSLDE